MSQETTIQLEGDSAKRIQGKRLPREMARALAQNLAEDAEEAFAQCDYFKARELLKRSAQVREVYSELPGSADCGSEQWSEPQVAPLVKRLNQQSLPKKTWLLRCFGWVVGVS